MKTSCLLIPILLFISSFFSQAQNGSISGVVSDSITHERKSNVLLLLSEKNKQLLSDEFGKFSFTGLEPGQYTLKTYEATSQGKTLYLKLGKDERLEIDIQLKSVAIQLSEVCISQTENHEHNAAALGHIDRKLLPLNSAQDLLQLVPGLFIAQHAGGGKAEQIFIRGFDCDHGTDFSVHVDGMPVNMVSHAHGQGYADLHFVIPETVDQLQVFKGPYYARYGNFATAGAGELSTRNELEKSLVKIEYGRFNTARAVLMANLLNKKQLFKNGRQSAYLAAEYNFTQGYFNSPQQFKRINVFAKYTAELNTANTLSFSASAFSSDWNASGQIPERAVREKMIDRFGSIDDTEGGKTGRNNLNLHLKTYLKNGVTLKNQIWYSYYHFDLFSNFTFFLNDSINGDQIEQQEKGRNMFGYNSSISKKISWKKTSLHSTAAIGVRADQGEIALLRSVKRTILDTNVFGKLSEQNYYAFLDETFNVGNTFSVNASLRADYFSFAFQHSYGNAVSGNENRARLSPKLNLYYQPKNNLQFFIRSGYGFHSNDSRSVVSGVAGNSLPRALGYETGCIFKAGKKTVFNVSCWGLDLENELVYVGDEGIVEINGPSRRLGIDFDARVEITSSLYADADLNYNYGRFTELPEGENFIPLAPSLTSTGGITYKKAQGLHASLRYRYINSRPANGDNSITARGYFLMDAVLNYSKSFYQIGISAENLLNTEWNQAQFETESRLKNESSAVNELHYTPGTPFFLKGSISLRF